MAKVKKVKTNKKNTKMRRTVLGALSAVFMISALIVAAIPSSQSSASMEPEGAQQLDPFIEQLQIKLKNDSIPYTTPGDSTMATSINEFQSAYPKKNPNPTSGSPVYTNQDGSLLIEKDSNGNGIVVGLNNNTASSISIPNTTVAFDINGGYALTSDATPKKIYWLSQESVPDPSDPAGTPTVVSSITPWVNTDGGYSVDDSTRRVTLDEGLRICVEDSTNGDIIIADKKYKEITTENISTYPILQIGGPDTNGKGVFENCTATSFTIGDKIEYIGERAFANVRGLKSLSIPDSVTYVGDYAFLNSGIESVSGANKVESFGTGCFAKSMLKNFTVGTNTDAIGPFCFADCQSLSAVELSSIRFLSDGAFYKCKALQYLMMPSSLPSVNHMNFVAYGCENLKKIQLPETASGKFAYDNVTACQRLQEAIIMSPNITLDCGVEFAKAVENSGKPNRFDDHMYGNYSGAEGGLRHDVDCFGPLNLGIFSENPREYYQNVFSNFIIRGSHDSTTPNNDYNYAIKHGIAYSYIGDMLEEKIEIFHHDYTYIMEPGTSSILTDIKPGASTPTLNALLMPSKIGPYQVTGLDSQTMHALNNENKSDEVAYVEVPSTYTTIGPNTFSGFTGLRTVKFDNAMNIQEIGSDAFKTNTSKPVGGTDDGMLRFIGTVSKDGVTSVPYDYCMQEANSYNNPTGWDKQYITYCTPFPTNQQIQLKVQTDPVTHQTTDAQPTLVAIPSLGQITDSASSTTYSLDPYYEDVENGQLVGIKTKGYNSGWTLEQFTTDLTDIEQLAVNACTRPEIPYGVMAYDYTPATETQPTKSVFNADGVTGNDDLVAITMNSIKSIGEDTFKGNDNLVRIEMRSSGEADGEKIGNNAFGGLANLETVILPNTLSEMGIAPFRDCVKLTGNGVDLGSGGKFSIANDIIYEAIDGGQRIVECLPIRGNGTDGTSNMIGTQDATGVIEIAPLAFYKCKYLKEADLSAAEVKRLPESAFENAEELQKCMLGDKIKNIGPNAFKKTKLYEITIPGMGVAIDTEAFETNKPLKLRGYRDSGVDSFAEEFPNYTFEEIRNVCIISFVDTLAESEDKKELGTKMVETGSTLGEPVNYNPPVHDGYTFIGWDPEDYYTQVVTGNMTVKTVYSDNAEANYIIGYYINEVDDAPFYKETVARDGFAAGPPAAVMRAVESAKPGYEFVGWSPSNFADIPITKDLKVVAQYVYTGVFPSAQPSVSGNTPGPSAYPSSNPGGGSGSGGTTVPTVPTDAPDTDSNDSAGTSSDNDGNSGNNEGSNGSNSGNNNSGTSGGNNNSTGNNNNNSGNNNSGTNNSQQSGSTVSGNRPGSSSSQTSSTTNGSSSIHVTKSGISNTGVAGVNVNGSQDNYVVKVSDSEEARTLAQQALLSEYGNLDSIKYFAMDISLYDSTGTTKLENETGVSVDVTIPIPDALREYGGNNMIGSVKGGQLEKLNNRFTTIDGVPCMTFTATHFSPYAIYVDTNNLTASGIIDTTPKTADPLEPKWFLAIGLALLSILMFLLRGPKNQIILSE